MTDSIQHTATWPTTIGAVCIVVGGLTLFGGCLSLTGMSEIEQLHTAVSFGDGELNDEVRESLIASAPPGWILSTSSVCIILFAVTLIAMGISLLQRNLKAANQLKWWSTLYIAFSLALVTINWAPRMDLVQADSTVQALFMTHIMISLPLYLALPIFLLIWLNRSQVRNELTLWR